jgi:hypothetical protein
MRLLNVHRLELETFDHRNAPPYAILSHTWGEDEVDYQTLIAKQKLRSKVRSGQGWAKILGTCKQAMLDNYDWVWIDTCNIDKSSSAELSEAINSMFVWYQRSAVCYVFLEDVHIDDTSQPFDIPKVLRPARWFTRGWTLQELIAPPNVVFYSSSWTFLGTKSLLHSILADITGVHDRVLENTAMLSTMSIAQKMSWAAQRHSTRVEDIAYSLLGIFDVTMPLLYGEGSRAFLRLQEELIKSFDDQTIFAWSLFAPLDSHTGDWDGKAWESLLGGGVLALHPLAFINSRDIIPQTRLDTSSEPTTITTRGILIEAYLMATEYPTRSVWLLPCSSTKHPGSVVFIPLKTPSSRTKRYSRIVTDIGFIGYATEAYMSDLSYKVICVKKAVEHNPSPISRICHLRSYPSHLLEPVEGLAVDLAGSGPIAGPLLKDDDGVVQNARPWDPNVWTVGLGTSHLHNGIALMFKFKPVSNWHQYLVISMALPGPSRIALTRHRSIDATKPSLNEMLELNLDQDTAIKEWIYIPEIKNRVSVKVDVDVEHGGIVYVFDVHFEPTQGRSDRFIIWKAEEDAEEQMFANCSVMLEVPDEELPEFKSRFLDTGEVGFGAPLTVPAPFWDVAGRE